MPIKNPTLADQPLPIKQYFESVNRLDPSSAAKCFSREAVLQNHIGRYVGREAVERWLVEICRLSTTLMVLGHVPSPTGVALLVSASGRFPGSPAQLNYHFTIKRGKIAELTIR